MSPLEDVSRLRAAKVKATKDLENAIVSAYEGDETMSTRALADAAGMSDEGVRKLLHRRGVSLRPRGGARPRVTPTDPN